MNFNNENPFSESKINTLFLIKKILCLISLSLLFNFFILMIIKRTLFANNKKIFNIIICFSSIIQTLSNIFNPNFFFINFNCLFISSISLVFQIEILLLIIFLNIFSIFQISAKKINRFILCIISLILGIAYLIM